MILILSTVTGSILGALLGINVLAAITDPEWATPINTVLLILITALAGHNGRSLLRSERKIERKIDDADEKIDLAVDTASSAADAAAAAAEASAAAARITKELGGAWRHVDPPALPKADAGAE